MSAPATLFAAFSPALAPGETLTPATGPAHAAADVAGDTFSNIMSQVSGEKKPAAPAAPPAREQPRHATTLAAMIAQSTPKAAAHHGTGTKPMPLAPREAAKAAPGVTISRQAVATTLEAAAPEPEQIVKPKDGEEREEKDDKGQKDTKSADGETPRPVASAPVPVPAPAATTQVPLATLLNLMVPQAPAVPRREANQLKSTPAGGDAVSTVASVETKAQDNQAAVPAPPGTAATPVAVKPHEVRKNIPGLTPVQPDSKPTEAKTDPSPAKAQPSVPSQPASNLLDGTAGALSSQRMNFTGEKNEIAGTATQKVPVATPKADLPAKDMAISGVTPDSGSSSPKVSAIDPSITAAMSVKSGDLGFDTGKTTVAAPMADHSTVQAERLGHMVSQQVMMIRQSGSDHLAVSLKLDPQTELNLQLTNHNGQIAASVRWERGGVEGLESHWKDLQESLAKQNVQLLPMESRFSTRTASNYSGSHTQTSSSNFRESWQNPRQRGHEGRSAAVTVGAIAAMPASAKTTNRTVSRQGWESWA